MKGEHLNWTAHSPSHLAGLGLSSLGLRPSPANGKRTEWDACNLAGSALMLAMMEPEAFGVPGGPKLTIFGQPPPYGVISLSGRRPQSSRGPDNRRTNIIEGLLNYWQDDPSSQDLRQALRHAWYVTSVALDATSSHPRIVANVARRMFAAPDNIVSDMELEMDTDAFALSNGLLNKCRFETCGATSAEPGKDGWQRSGRSWICGACQSVGLSPVHASAHVITPPPRGRKSWTRGGVTTVVCYECAVAQSFLHEEGVEAAGFRKFGKSYYCNECVCSHVKKKRRTETW